MWKSPVELAQLEALDKERRLTEEMEGLMSPPVSGSCHVVQGSNSEGKIMGSNSLGKLCDGVTPLQKHVHAIYRCF